MEIQRLNSDVINKLKSSSSISSFTHCVTELVLNSIDSKSTAISARINLISMRIQVVDNGEGITKENMKTVGQRYFTNKCKNWSQLQKCLKSYGFKGETLANISEFAQTINIISKYKNSNETFGKILSKKVSDEIKLVKNRPSIGTTVTVEGLFYNLPVRRKRIVTELELENVKKNIESLSIIHPNISFTVRNDITSELIVKSSKTDDIASAFKNLHPNIKGNFNLVKIMKEKVKVEALLFNELSNDRRLQYVFLNKRPIFSSKIQKMVHQLIVKNHDRHPKPTVNIQNKYPIFLVNIKCPYSRVDILVDPKTIVDFKDWGVIKKCIEKLICHHFGKERKNPGDTNDKIKPLKYKPNSGVSQIKGAFKGHGYKVENKENNDIADIIENTPNVFPEKHKDSFKFLNRNEEQDTRNLKNLETEHYTISQCTTMARLKNKMKKPLPIQIKNKNANPKPVNLKTDEDKFSGLSKFTNDENKGKNLIMDLFLKSTQVYKSDENLTDTRSEETIYEEESNFLLQNNFLTSVDGRTKAMSASINVRSTKKIKRTKIKVGKKSKAVQTSPYKGNVDKCIQLTLENKNETYVDCNPENYTVQFTKCIRKKDPILSLVHKGEKQKQINRNNFDHDMRGEKTCVCNCHVPAPNGNQISVFPLKFFDGVIASKVQQTRKSICQDHRSPYFQPKWYNSKYPQIETDCRPDTDNCMKPCGKMAPTLFGNNIYRRMGPIETTNKCLFDRIDFSGLQTDLEQCPRITHFREKTAPFEPQICNKSHNTISKTQTCTYLADARKICKSSCNLELELSKQHICQSRGFEDNPYNIGFPSHMPSRIMEKTTNIPQNDFFKRNEAEPFFSFTQVNPDIEKKIAFAESEHVDMNTRNSKTDFGCWRKDNLEDIKNNCLFDRVDKRSQKCSKLKNYPKNIIFPKENNLHVPQSFKKCSDPFPKTQTCTFFTDARGINSELELPKEQSVIENEGFETDLQNRQKNFTKNDGPEIDTSFYFKNHSDQIGFSSQKPSGMLEETDIPQNENFKRNESEPLFSFSTQLNRGTEKQTAAFADEDLEITEQNNKNKVSKSGRRRMRYTENSENKCLFGQVETMNKENRKLKNCPENVSHPEENNLYGPRMSRKCNDPFSKSQTYFKDAKKMCISNPELGNQQSINNNERFDTYQTKTLKTQEKCSKNNEAEINTSFYFKNDSFQIGFPSQKPSGILEKTEIPQNDNFKTNDIEPMLSFSTQVNQDIEKVIALAENGDVVMNEGNKEKEVEVNGSEWVKKYNNFGSSFYANKKTGFTTFDTPKESDDIFRLEERCEFLPIGMSPILTKTKPVDTSLSQNTKGKLIEYIMETYKNELLYVKWQNYLKDVDPDTFFENFYTEKLKMLNNNIPSIDTDGCKQNRLRDIVTFKKVDLRDMTVIGQVDKKFIAVMKEGEKLLLLFDQHAVHERIRLEKLLKEYKNSSSICSKKIMLFLPQTDIALLKKHETYCKNLGLTIEYFSNGIYVTKVPSLLHLKFSDNEGLKNKNKGDEDSIKDMVHILINQILEIFKTRGASFDNYPKLLHNAICMEACRGAIKFGDYLNNHECQNLLKQLSKCDLPFQCAHGRPTLTPLIDLTDNYKDLPYIKPNLEKLRLSKKASK